MIRKLVALCEKHQDLVALFRPFAFMHSIFISKENKIIDAYIFDWDARISANNHIGGAQLDFHKGEREGNHK